MLHLLFILVRSEFTKSSRKTMRLCLISPSIFLPDLMLLDQLFSGI